MLFDEYFFYCKAEHNSRFIIIATVFTPGENDWDFLYAKLAFETDSDGILKGISVMSTFHSSLHIRFWYFLCKRGNCASLLVIKEMSGCHQRNNLNNKYPNGQILLCTKVSFKHTRSLRLLNNTAPVGNCTFFRADESGVPWCDGGSAVPSKTHDAEPHCCFSLFIVRADWLEKDRGFSLISASPGGWKNCISVFFVSSWVPAQLFILQTWWPTCITGKTNLFCLMKFRQNFN